MLFRQALFARFLSPFFNFFFPSQAVCLGASLREPADRDNLGNFCFVKRERSVLGEQERVWDVALLSRPVRDATQRAVQTVRGRVRRRVQQQVGVVRGTTSRSRYRSCCCCVQLSRVVRHWKRARESRKNSCSPRNTSSYARREEGGERNSCLPLTRGRSVTAEPVDVSEDDDVRAAATQYQQ